MRLSVLLKIVHNIKTLLLIIIIFNLKKLLHCYHVTDVRRVFLFMLTYPVKNSLSENFKEFLLGIVLQI